MNENEISTIVITQGQPNEKPNMQDLLEELAFEEVVRLKRNLSVLDDLELMVVSNIKSQLSTNGYVDNGTLMKVIKTFNGSVNRSSNIIKDKNSSLVQILIDSRTVQEQQVARVNEEASSSLDLRSRKKIQSLLSALVTESNEEETETHDDEQTGSGGVGEEQNS